MWIRIVNYHYLKGEVNTYIKLPLLKWGGEINACVYLPLLKWGGGIYAYTYLSLLKCMS